MLGEQDGATSQYRVNLHYSSLARLGGGPLRPDSTDPVSVYRRTG